MWNIQAQVSQVTGNYENMLAEFSSSQLVFRTSALCNSAFSHKKDPHKFRACLFRSDTSMCVFIYLAFPFTQSYFIEKWEKLVIEKFRFFILIAIEVYFCLFICFDYLD